MGLIRTFTAWPSRLSTLVLLILHVCALGLFCTGFLLTRVELPNRSSPLNATFHIEVSQKPVHKTVWIIIDALRWDFVSNDSVDGIKRGMPAMPILQDTCALAVSLP